MSHSTDIDKLKRWFLSEKRDLPWRYEISPYAVWISEVMLQQTQVSVVIPYFLRWMERFPTVEALAQASLDTVIKTWEGLGYYSRARFLHEGARYVLTHFNGELPSSREQLQKIKGLGPYTIGAILSFAFHQKVAAVDGNVLRVLTRYYAIYDDIKKTSTVNRLRAMAESLLPEEESWIVNEALIELGATICQKKAHCIQCPLNEGCQAYAKGVTDQLPVKSKGAKTEYLFRAVAIVVSDGNYLIKRGKKGEIMSDLHEFPFFETDEIGLSIHQFQYILQEQYKMTADPVKVFSSVPQSFTRYQVRLDPVLFISKEQPLIDGLEWKSAADLKELAFSSGHRRILQLISDGD